MHKFIFTYRLFIGLNKYKTFGGYYLCYYAAPEDDFYSWQCFTKSQIKTVKKHFPIFEVVKEPITK